MLLCLYSREYFRIDVSIGRCMYILLDSLLWAGKEHANVFIRFIDLFMTGVTKPNVCLFIGSERGRNWRLNLRAVFKLFIKGFVVQHLNIFLVISCVLFPSAMNIHYTFLSLLKVYTSRNSFPYFKFITYLHSQVKRPKLTVISLPVVASIFYPYCTFLGFFLHPLPDLLTRIHKINYTNFLNIFSNTQSQKFWHSEMWIDSRDSRVYWIIFFGGNTLHDLWVCGTKTIWKE